MSTKAGNSSARSFEVFEVVGKAPRSAHDDEDTRGFCDLVRNCAMTWQGRRTMERALLIAGDSVGRTERCRKPFEMDAGCKDRYE